MAYLSVHDEDLLLLTASQGTNTNQQFDTLIDLNNSVKTNTAENNILTTDSNAFLQQIAAKSVPVPIPLMKQKQKKNITNSLPAPVTPYGFGQGVYSVVNSGTDVGYYGVADVGAYGSFKLDVDGYPLITEPYALSLVNNLDLPTSQVSSQIVSAVTSGSDAIVAAINAGGGGGGGNPPNLDIPLSEMLNTLVVTMYAQNAGMYSYLTNSILNPLMNGLGNLFETLYALLRVAPVSSIASDGAVVSTVSYNGKATDGLSLAELIYRGLFSSPILSDVTDSGTRTVSYGCIPYASAIVPYYAVAGAPGGTFVENYPLGANITPVGNSDFKAPYPPGFDPFADYDPDTVIDTEPYTTQLYLEPHTE